MNRFPAWKYALIGLAIAASTVTVVLPLETWTAGDSPKKFGSV